MGFLPLKWWYLSLRNKTNCPCRAVKKLYAVEYSSCHHSLCFPRHLASPTDVIGCRTEKHNSKTSLLPVQQNHAFLSTLHATYFAWRPFFSGIFHELWVTLTRLLVALRTAIHSASYSSESPALGSCSMSIICLKKPENRWGELFLLTPETD